MYQPVASSTLTNKELILALFNAIDSSNYSLLVNYFDENIIYERPGYQILFGIDKVLHFYQHERIIASGTHYLEQIVAEETYASCWGIFIGLSKNSDPIDEDFADVYSFENGKIKTRRSYFFRPAI